MSLNWVMLSGPSEFIRLPQEQILYKSPIRTSISLKNHRTYPGCEPYSVSCSSGNVFLTNRRIVYLPQMNSGHTDLLPDNTVFQSFTVPLNNIHDSHVTTPWLGPNAWVALVQPVPNGGIPASQTALEMKLTFKDGGAYEFHENLLRLRERLAQAREAAASTGSTDITNVHLEDLPAYEERPKRTPPVEISTAQGQSNTDESRATIQQAGAQATSRQSNHAMPDEPPPGYEEAQMASITGSVETETRRRTQAGQGPD